MLFWLDPAMRRLLRLDEPAAVRTEEDIAQEVEENYRWNFGVTLLDGATFWFGLSFASATTIVPLFISKLTASTLPLGIVAMISQGGWFLPQIFTSNYVERLARKKPVIVNLGLFTERLPMWLLVVAAMVAGTSPLLALFLFLIGYAWHGLGAGLVATAWQDLIARCFPVARRGRVLGITTFIGTGTAALGAGFSAWLLEQYAFPTNFVYTFAIAAGGITISWFFLALTREPVHKVDTPRRSNRQFFATLPKILKTDHNFRTFLVARLLLALGNMGLGFVTVAAVHRWAVADSTVGVYTGMLLIGQTLGNLGFGLLADRFGHKLSIELSAGAAALAFILAWLAPAPIWYYLVFVLLGLTLGGTIVSGVLVAMEFSEPARRPTYTGLTNTSVGVVSMAAPLLGAGLANLNYSWLFALSGGIHVLSLIVLRWYVREPRTFSDLHKETL